MARASNEKQDDELYRIDLRLTVANVTKRREEDNGFERTKKDVRFEGQSKEWLTVSCSRRDPCMQAILRQAGVILHAEGRDHRARADNVDLM
jgi:hypothetical protein